MQTLPSLTPSSTHKGFARAQTNQRFAMRSNTKAATAKPQATNCNPTDGVTRPGRMTANGMDQGIEPDATMTTLLTFLHPFTNSDLACIQPQCMLSHALCRCFNDHRWPGDDPAWKTCLSEAPAR